MPDPFITGQDVVDLLGRGDPADPGLVIVTDAACDMVRTYTEQQINAGTTTETYDGTGTDALLLPQYPVTAAGTVLVNGGTVTDYVLDARKGAVIRKRADPGSAWWDGARSFPMLWPRGRQNVTVTFEHGYAVDNVPQDIRMVALAAATRMFVQGPRLQETIGRQVAVVYAGAATDFTAGERIILGKYRRIGP